GIGKSLRAGTEPQLGLPQARREPTVTAYRHLAIDEQAQAFFETERLALRQVHLLAQCFGHARESESEQFVERGVIQHMESPSWLWEYCAPRILPWVITGAAAGGPGNGCRSRSCLRIDSILLYEHAPMRMARWQAASRRPSP